MILIILLQLPSIVLESITVIALDHPLEITRCMRQNVFTRVVHGEIGGHGVYREILLIWRDVLMAEREETAMRVCSVDRYHQTLWTMPLSLPGFRMEVIGCAAGLVQKLQPVSVRIARQHDGSCGHGPSTLTRAGIEKEGVTCLWVRYYEPKELCPFGLI